MSSRWIILDVNIDWQWLKIKCYVRSEIYFLTKISSKSFLVINLCMSVKNIKKLSFLVILIFLTRENCFPITLPPSKNRSLKIIISTLFIPPQIKPFALKLQAVRTTVTINQFFTFPKQLARKGESLSR